MKKTKIIMGVLCAAFLVFGMVAGASALSINPIAVITSDSSYFDGNLSSAVFVEQWSGSGTDALWDTNTPPPAYIGNPNSAADIAYLTGDASFTGNEFFYMGEVISPNVIITNNFSVSGSIYMVVKDGNQIPMWYIFNLTGWNGVDDLELTGFWPNNGNISHIGLFGNARQVPEPGTLLLLGLGLVGLAGLRRKF